MFSESAREKLNDFIDLVEKKAGFDRLSKDQQRDLYNGAINVFYFNDMWKLPAIDSRVVANYWWLLRF